MMQMKFILTFFLYTMLYNDNYSMETVKKSNDRCCCCCCCLCDCLKAFRTNTNNEKIFISSGVQVEESDFNIIYDTSHNITFLNSKGDGSYIYNNKSLNDGCIIRHGSNSLADVTSIEQDSIDYTSNDATLFSILKK